MKPPHKPNNSNYWKRYRNKNIDKIRKRDKDRKQFTREYLKYCDTEKYEEQKRKNRERERLTKDRSEKETAAAASMDQNQESTSTPSSAFKHKQTKFHSLKRADKALSNSPHKRNEIVKSLAKKYGIRI